jgi:hypothetical protein
MQHGRRLYGFNSKRLFFLVFYVLYNHYSRVYYKPAFQSHGLDLRTVV